jgi:hypothetical protein
MSENHTNKKRIIIYQLLPRLFQIPILTNKKYGTKEENGCGKLNDISMNLRWMRSLNWDHPYLVYRSN